MTAEGTRTRGFLEPSATAIPLHILRLRRIASKIQKKVYAATAQGQGQNLDEIIQQLHKELIDWRRDTPFPLPDLHPNVPHSSSTWYDFNFYTHLAMLYRPSPLCPTPNQNHLKILAEAAAMSIRQAVNMHRQKRLAYNWLNLLSVFTAAISLIYAITSTTEITVAGALSGRRVIEDLELVVELFDALRVKFTALTKLRDMLQEVISSFKEIVTVGEAP